MACLLVDASGCSESCSDGSCRGETATCVGPFGSDAVCECANAINLISFTATSSGSKVLVVWETGTEINNAGFNLYRTKVEGGPYTKINTALIPAQGNPVSGGSYSFEDSPGLGTFRYILTDLDAFGEITLHGPVMVKVVGK